MKTISDIDEFLNLDSSGLANTKFNCPFCGASHDIPFSSIDVGSGAIGKLPEAINSILGGIPKHPLALYDEFIKPIIEPAIMEPLSKLGLQLNRMGIGSSGILLDSSDVLGNKIANQISPATEILIGIGSGVICDLTKWIATRLHLPFILFGTAPSMNGYTSITATITENEIKKSKLLSPANAIVADIDVIAKAPESMILAGMQDLTARAICNADWKLSNILRKTYFCPLPYKMTTRTEKNYLSVAAGIALADPDAIHILTESIMVSGISMSILGDNTSPSSGGEHILSHFWDFLVHLRGVPKNLHGAQVGIGTILMLTLYDYMRHHDIRKIDPLKVLRNRPSLEEIERENKQLFGIYGPSFDEVVRQKRIPDHEFVDYVRRILNQWDGLWEQLDPYIASIAKVRTPLETAGVNLKLEAIHRSRQEGLEALLLGSRYRPRYTLLDLAWELGIFPQDAQGILEEARVL